MEERIVRGRTARVLSRRQLLGEAGTLGALLVAGSLAAARPAGAAAASPGDDLTLLAFADTVIPGRPASRTDLGDPIPPGAIAGVDREPGAVEADALRVFRDPLLGFRTLEGPLVAELQARAVAEGAPFAALPYAGREAVLLGALSFDNPTRVVFEAGAAVAFFAFCGAGAHPVGTADACSGYRVMGHPGAAPDGYRTASYDRRLAPERTRRGSLR